MQPTSIKDTKISAPLRTKEKFYNFAIDVLSKQQFFVELEKSVLERNTVSVFFLNAHCFNTAQKHPDYMAALHRATFLLNDGVGVDIAGKLVGLEFKENLNGTDLIPDMIRFFSERKMSIFCFGAKREVISQAVEEIQRRCPDASIAGYSDGYVRDSLLIVDQINRSGAEVVILGLGVPKQELWVDRYCAELQNAKVVIAGGAIFDFISGNVRRAPRLLRILKLEWLFRLLLEPRRLFSRYVIGAFLFLYYLITLRR